MRSIRTLALIITFGIGGMGAAGITQAEPRSGQNELEALALSATEQALIRDYYDKHGVEPRKPAGKRKSLPPGLQKKAARGEALPPGWQKKIARGEVLPESIYGYRQPLPQGLREQLPPQPSGTQLYRIDNEVVRVITAGRILADAFGL